MYISNDNIHVNIRVISGNTMYNSLIDISNIDISIKNNIKGMLAIILHLLHWYRN